MEYRLNEINAAAKWLIDSIGDNKHIAFLAEMGVGKTTLISEICRVLGISEPVNSPTFNIINHYESDTTGDIVYHFDFYRIKNCAEAYEIGFDDYVWSGNLCLMEWPERIEEALPDDTIFVSIKLLDDGRRSISIEK